jgi:putative membrane protein
MEQPEPTDYRFLLANERTFLAWIRTALSLQVAGLGVLQFLTHGHGAVRYVLGVSLVVAGSYVGTAGYLRYYRNERAIRAGEDLTSIRSSAVVAAAVIVLPLAAAIVLALAAAF